MRIIPEFLLPGWRQLGAYLGWHFLSVQEALPPAAGGMWREAPGFASQACPLLLVNSCCRHGEARPTILKFLKDQAKGCQEECWNSNICHPLELPVPFLGAPILQYSSASFHVCPMQSSPEHRGWTWNLWRDEKAIFDCSCWAALRPSSLPLCC